MEEKLGRRSEGEKGGWGVLERHIASSTVCNPSKLAFLFLSRPNSTISGSPPMLEPCDDTADSQLGLGTETWNALGSKSVAVIHRRDRPHVGPESVPTMQTVSYSLNPLGFEFDPH